MEFTKEYLEKEKEWFISLLLSTEREGVEGLLEWLEKKGFYEAPASSKFHGCFEGGLMLHSLTVYDELQKLMDVYPEADIPDSSAIIAALLHDLCKVDFYVKELKHRKDASGKWEDYYGYTVNEQFSFGGHGSKSLYLAQHFIKVFPDEAVAINCHMSCWDGNKDVGKAFEKYPLAWLLHVADESATYMKGI